MLLLLLLPPLMMMMRQRPANARRDCVHRSGTHPDNNYRCASIRDLAAAEDDDDDNETGSWRSAVESEWTARHGRCAAPVMRPSRAYYTGSTGGRTGGKSGKTARTDRAFRPTFETDEANGRRLGVAFTTGYAFKLICCFTL